MPVIIKILTKNYFKITFVIMKKWTKTLFLKLHPQTYTISLFRYFHPQQNTIVQIRPVPHIPQVSDIARLSTFPQHCTQKYRSSGTPTTCRSCHHIVVLLQQQKTSSFLVACNGANSHVWRSPSGTAVVPWCVPRTLFPSDPHPCTNVSFLWVRSPSFTLWRRFFVFGRQLWSTNPSHADTHKNLSEK